MNSIRTWFGEVYDEMMNKVSWPTAEELQESTVIVLVAAILLAVCVGIIDIGTHLVLNLIYK
jgi:preprotein translocase subunit SecE